MAKDYIDLKASFDEWFISVFQSFDYRYIKMNQFTADVLLKSVEYIPNEKLMSSSEGIMGKFASLPIVIDESLRDFLIIADDKPYDASSQTTENGK